MAARKKKKNVKKTKVSFGQIVLVVFLLVFALIMAPTTFFLLIGMLPTWVLLFVDNTPRKSKTIAVGSVNLAACFLFLVKIWQYGNEFSTAIEIITQPMSIVVMYCGAALGYFLDWSLSSVAVNILYERSRGRSKAIDLRKNELVKRWGPEVQGSVTGDSISEEDADADGDSSGEDKTSALDV